MITKSQALKDCIDTVRDNLIFRVRRNYSCLLQKNKLTQYISRVQNYEHRFEKTANRPVKFLRFIKNMQLISTQDTLPIKRNAMPSLIQEINIENVIDILTGFKITGKGKRRLQEGLDLLLTMMSSPVLQE